MFDPSKAIKKMLGPGINVPRYRQGKSMRDSDGDGINDIMDCQPKNMFRQDVAGSEALYAYTVMNAENPDQPTGVTVYVREKLKAEIDKTHVYTKVDDQLNKKLNTTMETYEHDPFDKECDQNQGTVAHPKLGKYRAIVYSLADFKNKLYNLTLKRIKAGGLTQYNGKSVKIIR